MIRANALSETGSLRLQSPNEVPLVSVDVAKPRV